MFITLYLSINVCVSSISNTGSSNIPNGQDAPFKYSLRLVAPGDSDGKKLIKLSFGPVIILPLLFLRGYIPNVVSLLLL